MHISEILDQKITHMEMEVPNQEILKENLIAYTVFYHLRKILKNA